MSPEHRSGEPAQAGQTARRFPWLPFLFVGFLVGNWTLRTTSEMLSLQGYVTSNTSELAFAVATVSLVVVALLALRLSTREVRLPGLWPSMYVAAGLAVLARAVYFIVHPIGGWAGVRPALSQAAERAIEDALIYAAELILVAGFCRVMLALRMNLIDLKAEQKRLLEEQAALKRAQEHGGRLEQQLLQAQKMESIGRLAGGVAHDINNMLTPILGYADMLARDLAPDNPSRLDLEQISAAATRARDLTRQLLAFAGKQTLQVKPLNLNEIVIGFERMLRSSLRENIEVRTHLSPTLGSFAGDAGQIEQVLMNLVLNAQDAMPDGGILVIETAEVLLDETYVAEHEGVTPGPHVLLLVSDTGNGMDKETCARIFEPFFTTKTLGGGVGLGLSSTHGIVKQHQGSIWVYSEPGKGTTFKIYFPRTETPSAPAQSAKASSGPPHGSGTVLVAEDNERVRTLAGRMLRGYGYTVFEAIDGKTALEIAESHPGKIGLLVTDVVMPDTNGRALYESLAAKWPELKVLYMSGYSENVIAHQGALNPDTRFIQKPFSVDGFLSKVREALG